MSNYLLLCHGGLNEFGSFDLQNEMQTVIYRGNYGSVLGGSAARQLVQILLDDPESTDPQIRRAIPNYTDSQVLVGKQSFRPDVRLSGDDRLLCFIMNLGTRKWLLLPGAWGTTLNHFVAQQGRDAFCLNLLCCTLLEGSNVEAPQPDPTLRVRDWESVLASV